jgi:hypothetical protein|nr:MAG TPA: hypothetical protein [Caudoviricetes sp.]
MEGNENNNAQNAAGQNNANQIANNNAIDYEKIQAIVEGRNAKTEDSILKSYFQQQGLSADEMKTAIEDFKTTKAQKAQQASLNEQKIQNENATLRAQIQQMKVNEVANKCALEIGVDPKTIPYLIRMADLTGAVGQDGKISEEAVKTAFNSVLEALPQLKGSSQQDNTGFQKIGGENNNKTPDIQDRLKEIFS